jgi:N utilization substance protein A
VLEIEGVTLPMAVALGEGDVKTVEDLAGLVPDDLRGWFESKNGERVREAGILDSFNLSPEDAEALIMRPVSSWAGSRPRRSPSPSPLDDAEGWSRSPRTDRRRTLRAVARCKGLRATPDGVA